VRVTVTGATGMIGRALVGELLARGDEVTALGRDPARARAALPAGVQAVAWPDPKGTPAPPEGLRGRDAVVHLAGERLDQRWSAPVKREVRDSRVLGTRNLVAALRALEDRPATLISQSAVGYYGPHGDERIDEKTPAGDDFLARVCREWEAEAERAEELGVRVVRTRTGVVLSASGGALRRMLPPFRLGVGGPVASGRQYVAWVHLDDVVGAILLCLDDPRVHGPVNVTAPDPATNRELARALGRVLRRPAVVPVPAPALRLLYGEMATTVTTGARVVPSGLRELGYRFRRPELEEALRAAVRGR
jgi:uncharacterized protein (TIGR01777 family)